MSFLRPFRELSGPKAQQPRHPAQVKPVVIGCSIALGVGLFTVLAVVIALFIWLSSGPEGGVRLSNEMEDYALEYIQTHKLLNPTETLIAYYDVTLSCDGSEAAILTNERVLYHKRGRNQSIALGDIEAIDHRQERFSGDIIEVRGTGGQQLKIEIAMFNNGKSFYAALRHAWENR